MLLKERASYDMIGCAYRCVSVRQRFDQARHFVSQSLVLQYRTVQRVRGWGKRVLREGELRQGGL